MSAKDSILDFINYSFMIILVVLAIIIFINPVYFNKFSEIMKAAIPLSFFGLIFLVKLKLSRDEVRKKKQDNNTDLTLYLTYFDKMKIELTVFLLPIIIIIISLISEQDFTTVTFFQAIISFLLMYLWQKILFNKAK